MRGDGSSNEERRRTGRRYRTDRTEGISDGVFAVSLTLLILDVRPPEGGVSQLVHGLVLIAPRLGTFALSFAIVAYYWLVHHLIFRTTDSRPTTLHCAAFRCAVDGRAAGDRMRVPRSGTRTEHLRRAADCVRADLPPALLLTVVVRHGATRHGGRNGASRLSGVCEMGTWLCEPGHTAAMFRAGHLHRLINSSFSLARPAALVSPWPRSTSSAAGT